MNPNSATNPGIYIHIPFCEKKCGYCDFYSITDLSSRKNFLISLQNEFHLIAGQVGSQKIFDTIYFGGGTPSLLSAPEIQTILEQLASIFKISPNAEITLEANPGAITQNILPDYRRAGINRLSIGIQSFNDRELQFLGRIHTAEQAESTILSAQAAGFDNYSIDLIFAFPGQSIKSWDSSLKKAFALQPTHISAYNLIYEEGTPFYKQLQNNEISAQPEDEEIVFWEHTLDTMEANGFQAYEVSNFATSPKFWSRHNVKYWTHTPYLGFGPSAHSFWNNKRWSNLRSVEGYISALTNGNQPLDHTEILDKKTLEFEYIFLSLRTYRGLNLSSFKQIFEISFLEKYTQECNDLLNRHLAVTNQDFFKLTRKGMIICDAILPEFYRA